MYKDGDDLDDLVTITVENTEIRCNRKKLSECSRYFDVLFNGNFLESNEKTVTIQDVKSSVFEAILSFVEDAHSVDKDDLLDVLEVACMLQFDNLREYCVERLTDGLSVATCLQVWQMCERLNVQPLATKAKCKALLEFNAIKDSDNITVLSLEELHSYLASTSLHCENELDVFKCGMKWWHAHSKNGESKSDANNCLITVLNCLDYECVSCKDVNIMKNIAGNSFVTNLLNGFLGRAAKLPPDVRATINTLKQDRKRRDPEIRPCVISMDEDNRFDISFYDKDEKAMRKFINVHLHDNEQSHELQEHMGVFSYKENILCFGQGKQDEITSVWMYNTLKEKWQHVTRFPQVRSISDSCILNDKLFIIGTSGSKSKINDMMYYDFTKDEWTTNIKLPKFEFDCTCCEFQKKLFVMFDKHRKADRNTGYFYIPETRRWQRVNVQDKNELIWEPWDTFSMFSDKNRLYVQGFTMDKYLIEMVLVKGVLEVKSCKEFEPLQCNDCEYFKSGRHLYIFSNTDDKSDKKYDNDDYSDGPDYFDELDNYYDMSYYDMNYYDINYYGDLYDYSDDDRQYFDTLSRYCLTDNTTDLLLTDKLHKENWVPDVACFGLFHYSIVSRDTRVSKFTH